MCIRDSNITLDIRDQTGRCSNTGASIAGAIHTYQDKAIEGVEVISSIYTEQTQAQGLYAFANMPLDESYEISAYKNDDLLNGVTAIDMVLIQRHIVGRQKIESPYLSIAADVNNDGRISAIDLVVMRNAILGRTNEFTNNTSWKFIDALFDMTNNGLAPYDQTINIEQLDHSISDADFIGVKIGDVNDNAIASSLSSNGRSSNPSDYFIIDDQYVTKGEEVSVAIKAKEINEIEAFQFTMSMPQLIAKDVNSDNINISDLNIWQYEGGLTMVWHRSDEDTDIESDHLFKLVFIAQQDGRLSELLDINSDITKALIYREDEMGDISLELQFEEIQKSAQTSTNRLYQNVPNPFSKETIIGFELSNGGETTLSIFDITGTLIHEVRQTFSAGYNEIKIDGQSIKDRGVLIYRLDQGDYSDYKRMVIID